MKKIQINLAIWEWPKGRYKVPWPAYASDNPGLAICKAPDPHPDGNGGTIWKTARGKWQVIHISSGYVLPNCHDLPTREAAKHAANAIGDWVDWEKDKREIYMCLQGYAKKWAEAIQRAIEG